MCKRATSIITEYSACSYGTSVQDHLQCATAANAQCPQADCMEKVVRAARRGRNFYFQSVASSGRHSGAVPTRTLWCGDDAQKRGNEKSPKHNGEKMQNWTTSISRCRARPGRAEEEEEEEEETSP